MFTVSRDIEANKMCGCESIEDRCVFITWFLFVQLVEARRLYPNIKESSPGPILK